MDGQPARSALAFLAVDAFENLPGKRTIAAMVGGIAAVAVAGLMLLGGQSSMILSNVGAPIGEPNLGGGVDTSGDTAGGDHQDQPQGGEPNGARSPTLPRPLPSC
jgi:hypothetical protein